MNKPIIYRECILCNDNNRKKFSIKCISCKKIFKRNNYSKSQWNRGKKKWKPISFCNNCNNKINRDKIQLNYKKNKKRNSNLNYVNKVKLKCCIFIGTPFYRNCLNQTSINLCDKHVNEIHNLSNKIKLRGEICFLCKKYYCNKELREIHSCIGDTCCNTSTIKCYFCKNSYCYDHDFFIENDKFEMCKICLLKKNKIVLWFKEIMYHPNSNFIKRIGKEWTKKALN